MDFKGSKTEKNLMAAVAGESQARNRYTYFAKQAKKEGYEQIAAIFQKTADQEMQHAKQEFKFLQGGEVEITAAFPAGVIGSTLENLKAAAAGENYENTIMYPDFAKVAADEGFKQIAAFFKYVAIAEKNHEDIYNTLINNINEGLVFKKPQPVKWVCRKCGYIHEADSAVNTCPVCVHPQAYFELAANY